MKRILKSKTKGGWEQEQGSVWSTSPSRPPATSIFQLSLALIFRQLLWNSLTPLHLAQVDQNENDILQVCDGIVRSKLPLFDQSKRQGRGRLPYNQVLLFVFFCFGHFFTFTLSMQAEFLFLQGFVKARLAMFDKPTPKPSRKLVSGSRHFQEIINNWWFNFNSE